MKKILLIIGLFITVASNAQDTEIATRLDTYPYFQKEKCEGLSSEELTNCSQNNFAEYAKTVHYPEQAIIDKVEGKVYLRFIVHANGAVDRITVAKSSGNDYLDRAAIQHISKTSGLWSAATKDGKEVASEFVVPFTFSL